MRASTRRESEQRGSLSGDLLGKFSSIVRRASNARGDAMDDDNNNNNQQYYTLGGDLQSPLGGVAIAPPPTVAAAPAGKGFGFHFAANMRRFSKAAAPTDELSEASPPANSAMEAAMGRVIAEPERQRRYDIEIMSFALLHEHFQPVHAPELDDEDDDGELTLEEIQDDNNQADGEDEEEEAVRRRSRQSTADVDEHLPADDDDDEDKAVLVRLKRNDTVTSESSVSEDDAYDHTDESNNAEEQDGELNFDQPNLGASVRKLVLQIENASLDVDSSNSNQDEDAHDHSREIDRVHLDHELQRRVTYPVVPHHGYAPPPPRQSCYIPMDEVQEELTQSVRRLVIGLKKDSEAQDESTPLSFARRRGNSCPPPYRPQTKSSTADSSASTAASVTMDTGPAEPPRWRKRSAFARLAPKFLDNFRRKRKSYLYTDEELESIEGARWKIVELAFRFGGKHRFYLVQAVNMFFPLIKYGRHGGPHPTRLHCNRCGTLQWQHKRGGLSEPVDLADVLHIIDGRQTAVFHKYTTNKTLDGNSLSLIFKERTLDLETQSTSHRDWLMSALRTLVAYARKQRQAEQRAIAERAVMSLDFDSSEASMSSASRSRNAYLASGVDAVPRLLW